MNTRVSFKKQDIKQDKFAEFVSELREAATENVTYILGALAVVVLIVAGVYFYQGSAQDSLAQAHERMAKAKTDITVGNMQVALLELRDIADKNQGSEIGAEALYLLGSANFLNLNFAEARTAFEEYVKRYSKRSITNAAARAGIAACMENTGEYAPAAAEYLKALDSYPDGPAAQDYAVGALRCYLLAGDRAAASELRERITRDYWRTPAVTTAERLFHEIKPAG